MAIFQEQLFIGGQVQGVGYRPFVYRLATQYALRGWVRNEGARVRILVQGEQQNLDRFCEALIAEAPSIARPRLLERHGQRLNGTQPDAPFEIRASAPADARDIHVPPDYFTCEACLAELQDPHDRRYRYPFINCTQCGPRYTLIRALPYDRQRTTMAGFGMCPDCRAEYTNPADRRFHAEPIACPQCGPQLTYRTDQQSVQDNQHALQACIEALRAGSIVAIKGIGGYHLCCDATNPSAVVQLRVRKNRPHKPLALMYPRRGRDGLQRLRKDVIIDETAAAALREPARPIVLVPRREDSTLPDAIAPGLDEVGVMLPYSPLHHLLLDQFAGPLVMTSANISGEPVLTEADEVEQRLGEVTRVHLHHNRPIARPADDSVVRSIAGRPRPLRVGRGLSPLELQLPNRIDTPLLACGGHMKNTLALAWEDRVVVSAHIGDLDSPRSQSVYAQTVADLQALYGVDACYLVCDAHPGYASSRWARDQRTPRLTVFHHHAHAAMLAGEYPHVGRWLVFTWDGVGYGEDGSLWGGEALLGQPGHWRRVAHWRPFNPPGGEKAGRQPWRSAAALCWASGHHWRGLSEDHQLIFQAWQKGINAPATTATGRLFDAAAALLGLCSEGSFEGQGPMLVEARAARGNGTALPLPLEADKDGVLIHDWSALVPMLLDAGASIPDRAYRFHASLAAALVDQAEALRERHGEFAVGFSGGVFQNRLLAAMAIDKLSRSGFQAYLPERVPVNDGGLSFGQIIEAAARMRS